MFSNPALHLGCLWQWEGLAVLSGPQQLLPPLLQQRATLLNFHLPDLSFTNLHLLSVPNPPGAQGPAQAGSRAKVGV